MYNQEFRQAALIVYNYLGNMKKTAKALNIGIGTVWRWVNNGIERKQRSKKTHITAALLAFVKSSLEQSSHLTQSEIKLSIQKHLNISISRQCISTIIKKIGYSRKRLRKRGYTKKGIGANGSTLAIYGWV